MMNSLIPAVRSAAHRAKNLVPCLATILLLTAAVPAPPARAQAPARVALATLTPEAFAAASDAGPLPSSQRLSLTLTLAATPARAAALDLYLAELSTPSSPSFHKWLTPAQFAASYGATPDQLAAATSWARAQGLTVDAVSAAGNRLVVSGAAADVQSAFAVQLDAYQINGHPYFANTSAPSLAPDAAQLFVNIEGLDDFPCDLVTFVGGRAMIPGTKLNGSPVNLSIADIANIIDANATPILAIDANFGTSAPTASRVAAYSALFRQASAQGITTLLGRLAVSQGFPVGLAEVTHVAAPGDNIDSAVPFAARPSWQVAAGLPGDSSRYTPDLTAASVTALAQTLGSISLEAGGRLGNINPVLYQLASEPGLFTQPDAAPAGTWEYRTGLGLVSLDQLGKVYPRGTGQSFTSFQATNYSPIHGQGTSFSSTVTSGTGGGVPTGTVSFVTSTGTVLGTVPLVGGSATFSISTLDGGNYTIQAVYSGDATYASSTSPSGQLFVQPEPSKLSVAITGTPSVGGSYMVTVTDTAPSGIGQPTGSVSVAISGTGNIYTATLTPAGTGASSATVTIPATTAGTLTLMITCTTTANYSCYNPYTANVTIAKATPTLSISYSPNPPVSGQSITLNATVSTVGTAPAPTGNVLFADNGTTLNSGSLTNGATTTTGTVPTTATHSITATYQGDSNYNAVSTTSGSTTSGTINTTTTLQSSSSSVSNGQVITFTATITPAATGPANPTGTVQFLDSGAPIGTANVLANNTATFPISTLSASTNHLITAVYSGDGYYNTSTSNTVTLTKSTATITTSTGISASTTTVTAGQNITFTATITPASAGAANPTGTVTFYDGTTFLGTSALTANMATFTTNTLSATASHSITAAYSGDTIYSGSTSPILVLNKSGTTITTVTSLSANATVVNAGQPITFTASVTPTQTLATAVGGTVSFFDGSTLLGTSTVANGSATLTTSTLAYNTSHSVTAIYSGDANYSGSASNTVILGKTGSIATTSALTASSYTVTGQSITFTDVVSATAGTTVPTGSVTLYDGTAIIGTTLLVNGTATLSTASLSAAVNHTLTAVYSGDATYAASTSNIVVVNRTGAIATTTALAVISPTIQYGGTTTFNVTVTPASLVNNTAPTGTITFTSGTITLATQALVNGSTSYSPMNLPVNTYSIVAMYSGDANYASSSSTAMTVIVTPASVTITAAVTPNPAPSGSALNVAVTLTPPGTNTSFVGTVTATIAGATGAGSTVSTAFNNTTTALNLALVAPATAGTYQVVVSCSGGGNFTCPTVTLPFTTTGTANTTKIATTTVLTLTPAAPIAGQAVTYTATVTAASAGAAVLSGTVNFFDGTTLIGSGTITAATTTTGTATLVAALPATTTHSITAVYSGDTNYAASVSAPNTVTGVAATPAKIVLTTSTTNTLAGIVVVLTAQVSGSTVATATTPSASPTGTVTFYVSGTTPRVLGTVPLSAAGAGLAIASLPTTGIPAGTQVVYAVYSGDVNFSAITSNSITIGLGDYSVTFVPQSLTLSPGQKGTTTLIVNVSGGFTGGVVFGCVPPPNTEITCVISPTNLAASGSAVLTVITTAPTSSALTGRPFSRNLLGGFSFAAILCLLIPGRNRRRLPLLLALLAIGLTVNLGCGTNNFNGQNPADAGTPLGTTNVIVNTAGSDGTNTVRHNYTFQVTVQ